MRFQRRTVGDELQQALDPEDEMVNGQATHSLSHFVNDTWGKKLQAVTRGEANPPHRFVPVGGCSLDPPPSTLLERRSDAR
jgi:hypothetical protein